MSAGAGARRAAHLSDLYPGSMLPWLIWTTAALSLTGLMGLAGQLHFGFGAVMAIGADTSIHLARAGAPFEVALLGAGLVTALIGSVFGAAVRRVKGLYRVVATLAMRHAAGGAAGGKVTAGAEPLRSIPSNWRTFAAGRVDPPAGGMLGRRRGLR